MDDELRESDVEHPAGKGQLLRERLLHVDRRIALAGCHDERLGGIDGRHCRCPYPFDELGRECAGPTADVEHSLAIPHPGKVGELR